MATRFKDVIALLAAVMVVATAACSNEPAPDVDADQNPLVVAQSYFELGECQKGIEELKKSIPDFNAPNEATAYVTCGVIYGELGQYQLATQDFDRAIQLDPGHVKAYGNRGWSYLQLGQYQRAIQDHDKAIQIDPTYALAYNNRGVTYGELGQYIKQKADEAKARSLDKQHR